MTVPEDWVPDACTLPTPERPVRVAEFDELFTRALRSERVQPTQLWHVDVLDAFEARTAAR